MKIWTSSTLAAFALASFTTALVRPSTRALQRRTDAPPLPPCPSNNYKPYTYVGCFKEGSPRSLQYNPDLQFSTMTVETCTATCKSNGFKYAGLLYFGICHCGTKLPLSPVSEAECDAGCNGNPSQTCGANQRYSIWQDPTYPVVDPATVADQYVPLGCYTEGLTSRAISYRQDQLSFDALTPEACTAACGQQYLPYAGTEFGGECYCGYQLLDGSAPAPSSECNMACTGDASQTCGGPRRLNVYEAKILQSTEPCGSAPPPPPKTCQGTAYGYIPGKSQTFVSLSLAKNWGWVLTGTPPMSGTLYLGAGGNDLGKATAVGTFTISVIGKNVVVTFKTDSQWSLGETHLYYGNGPPKKIAPGQFGNAHDGFSAGTTTDQFTLPYEPSKKTYILHASIEYECGY